MQLRFIDPNSFEVSEDQLITSSEGVDKNGKFVPDGIYSEEIFGKMYGDSVEYVCQCGATKGKFNLGVTCIKCESEVERKNSMISRQGWIDFGSPCIINPVLYRFISKLIGPSRLERFLQYSKKLDIDGNVVDGEDAPTTKDKYAEYNDIGMTTFAEMMFGYEEERARILAEHGIPESESKGEIVRLLKEGLISEDDDPRGFLEYFNDESKYANDICYNLIMENREKLLIRYLPVFNHRLRPAIMIQDQLIYDKINILYGEIITANNTLSAMVDGERENLLNTEPLLWKIQQTVNQISDKILDTISGKSGFMRKDLLGNRVNFSTRCVIVPLPTGHEIDEIQLPYLAAVELFKFHIINVIVRTSNVSYNEALKQWNAAAAGFSPKVYKILCDIIDRSENGVKMLLNRNPTISWGSILMVRLTSVKKDYTDLTMAVSNNILKLLGGDFDGDVLSAFLLTDQDYVDHFERFNPKRMIISNDDGKFNGALGLDKDHVLGLYSLVEH